jgi:hypothetical protein
MRAIILQEEPHAQGLYLTIETNAGLSIWGLEALHWPPAFYCMWQVLRWPTNGYPKKSYLNYRPWLTNKKQRHIWFNIREKIP